MPSLPKVYSLLGITLKAFLKILLQLMWLKSTLSRNVRGAVLF